MSETQNQNQTHVHERIMSQFNLGEEDLIRKSLLLMYFLYEEQAKSNRIYVYLPGELDENGEETNGVAKIADINAFLNMPFEELENASKSEPEEPGEEEVEKAEATVA